MKLAFILISIGLAIRKFSTQTVLQTANSDEITAFGVLKMFDRFNDSAIIEWVIALVFTGYVLSFAIDFLPVNVERLNRRATDLEKESSLSDRHVGSTGHNFLPHRGSRQV